MCAAVPSAPVAALLLYAAGLAAAAPYDPAQTTPPSVRARPLRPASAPPQVGGGGERRTDPREPGQHCQGARWGAGMTSSALDARG